MSRIHKINCLAYKVSSESGNDKLRDLGIKVEEDEAELKVMPMFLDLDSIEFFTLLEEYSEEQGMTLLEVFLKSGAQVTLNIKVEELKELINGN